ncbi:MAG: peptidase S41 [Bacteroidetes bacterium 4572_77]|nr:MAG: peptidase S41 [Bacteroidetes bacterium 4572_77]
MSSFSNNKIYTPIIIAMVFIVGLSVGRHYLSPNSIGSVSSKSKLHRIINYIERDYVDTIDIVKMETSAIEDLIKNLDPHSAYIKPAEYHNYVDPLRGNFEGIGIQFRMIRDSLTVMLPLPGGPSEKAGLLAGDKIVMVENDTIAGKKLNTNDITKKIKGEKGSLVHLKIHRTHTDSLLSFDVYRDVIPTYSLDAHFMINDSLGYIKISKFSATTIEEFNQAISDLLEKNMTQLILDLRGNSGGYLNAAITMSDAFIAKDELIVYTDGHNRPEKKYYAKGHGDFENQKLIILINENSASASEIVAGAVQDNDRGTIVGRRSFGKGLVQEQLDFSDGSALRLTVARYYTPTGRSIQRSYEEGNIAYYADHYHQMLTGENPQNDSIKIPDSLIFTTPKGKTVYGGGGILPDVVIPFDTNINYSFYNQIVRKSIISELAIDYFNQYKEDLKIYKDVKDFDTHFKLSKKQYKQITQYAEQQEIKSPKETIEQSKNLILNLYKAEIARLLFHNHGYYYIVLQEDPSYIKSVALMDSVEE